MSAWSATPTRLSAMSYASLRIGRMLSAYSDKDSENFQCKSILLLSLRHGLWQNIPPGLLFSRPVLLADTFVLSTMCVPAGKVGATAPQGETVLFRNAYSQAILHKSTEFASSRARASVLRSNPLRAVSNRAPAVRPPVRCSAYATRAILAWEVSKVC